MKLTYCKSCITETFCIKFHRNQPHCSMNATKFICIEVFWVITARYNLVEETKISEEYTTFIFRAEVDFYPMIEAVPELWY